MTKSAGGGEYEFYFEKICLKYDIIHRKTAIYLPQSNGIA